MRVLTPKLEQRSDCEIHIKIWNAGEGMTCPQIPHTRSYEFIPYEAPRISGPIGTGDFGSLTCTGKLRQDSLEISASANQARARR